MDSHVFRYLVRSRALALGIFALALTDITHAQVVVNAPVAPDAIYVGRIGNHPGISVIDLNGFGQSTGNPTFDPTFQSIAEGDSNFPNNPNVRFQGSFLGLVPGTSTLDGGSAGVFTLTLSSQLDPILLGSPDLLSVGDMMLGAPLDLVYNNGPAPFGCLSGGGSLCTSDSRHIVDVSFNGAHGLQPTPLGGQSLQVVVGQGNPISFAPSPNPPSVTSYPSCFSPLLNHLEPISILASYLSNLLDPGDPFGDPLSGVPPSGLLAKEQNAFFVGPSFDQATLAACEPYQIRQQIGHFVYVIDRTAHEIVVLNSNTFTVIARIHQDDPTELAMSPNLTLLAVTNRSLDKVSFIDIDPRSATFHQVVQETPVGHLPRGIAWDPGNEDIFVCNEGGNSVSIISNPSLQVRKTLSTNLTAPFAVAMTQRVPTWGTARFVYYAYILDRSGRVSLFESGPNTVSGWGFDDIIGQTDPVFTNATAMQPDPIARTSGVWITHEGQLDSSGHPTGLGGGAVTNLVLYTAIPGIMPLGFPAPTPNLRGVEFKFQRSIGSDQLTGLPLDLAFDDQVNLGALSNYTTPFSPGVAAQINGKSTVRNIPGVGIRPTNWAHYMFVTVKDRVSGGPKAIDVLDLATGLRVDVNRFHPGTQSIPARGASVVMDYFRQ